MIIKNANVYKEDYKFYSEDIHIQGEYIVGSVSEEERVIDASGLYAIPGLTDIHFHGCVGYDFCDGSQEALDAISRYQGANGITTICPATMTLSEEELTQIVEVARDYQYKEGAILCGINMEIGRAHV